MKLLTILLLTGLLSTPIAHMAYAQSSSVNAIGSKAPGWAELSTPQKEVLASLEEDWASLTPEQKSKWAQLANRYDQFSDTEKERLKIRMLDWSKLSIKERRTARANFIKSQSIPNEKKAEAWEAYQQLSPEEKKQLADEANSKQKKPSLVNAPSLKPN